MSIADEPVVLVIAVEAVGVMLERAQLSADGTPCASSGEPITRVYDHPTTCEQAVDDGASYDRFGERTRRGYEGRY